MTEESKLKLRELHPRKLIPPPEVTQRIMNKDREQLPKNRILRFFKIFFGDGF